MQIIPQVTCRRCGRQFSGLRGRCPYCGTRKVSQSERTPANTASVKSGTASNARAGSNAQWQMIFGIILLVAVIAAVITLVSLSLGGEGRGKASPPPESTPPVQTQTPTAPPTPSPTPTPEVSSITINYYSQPSTGFATDVGQETPMNAKVYPVESGAVVEWSVENEAIITVEETADNQCVVTGVSSGTSTLYAECGGIRTSIQVWVR